MAVSTNTTQSSRRLFLPGLAGLPLVGGGVSIIGAVKANVPITPELLDSYDAWLHFERRWLNFNRFGPERYKKYGDFVPRPSFQPPPTPSRHVDRPKGHGAHEPAASAIARAAIPAAAHGGLTTTPGRASGRAATVQNSEQQCAVID
jgi:hypothetical protein